MPAAKRKGSGWIWVVLALVVVLGLAAAAVYLGTRDDSPGGSGAANAATGGQPVIAGASAFDPFGDGQEDDLHAAQAVDGAAATVWSTEQYNDPLERTKKGVGLRIDLERETVISSVRVQTTQGGWSGEIYVATAPGDALGDWGEPRASGTDLGTDKTFDTHEATGRYVLVWLTVLPKAGDVYRLQITEVTVA